MHITRKLKSEELTLETPGNCIDISHDEEMIAVVGKSYFRIFAFNENDKIEECTSLKSAGVRFNNVFCNDVKFSMTDPSIVATACSNGSVVVCQVSKCGTSRQTNFYKDDDAGIHRIGFHPKDPNVIISGSQDGAMRMHDLRSDETLKSFGNSTEKVWDIQFSLYPPHHFATSAEGNVVQLWDIRNLDKCAQQITGYGGPVFSIHWHPIDRNCIATASRDCTITIFDLTENTPETLSTIDTPAAISRLRWRPEYHNHIGSSFLTMDSGFCVWDVCRPHVPLYSYAADKEVTASFVWRQSTNTILSISKDGRLFHHYMEDTHHARLRGCPVPVALNLRNDLTFCTPTRSKNKEIAMAELLDGDQEATHAHRRQRSVPSPSCRTPTTPATPSGPGSFTGLQERQLSTAMNTLTPSLVNQTVFINPDYAQDLINFPLPESGMQELYLQGFIGPILSQMNIISDIEALALTADEDDVHINAVEDFAINYKLEGGGQLHSTCTHNAGIARRNLRSQEAALWELIAVMYGSEASDTQSPSQAPLQGSSVGGSLDATTSPNGGKFTRNDSGNTDNNNKMVTVRSPSKEEDDERTLVSDDEEGEDNNEDSAGSDGDFYNSNSEITRKGSSKITNSLNQSDIYFGEGEYSNEQQESRPRRRTCLPVRSRRNRLLSKNHKENGPNEQLLEMRGEAFNLRAADGGEGGSGRALHNSAYHEDDRRSGRRLDSDSGGEDSGELDTNNAVDNLTLEGKKLGDSSTGGVLMTSMSLSVHPSYLPSVPAIDYTEQLVEALKHTALVKNDVATTVTIILVLGNLIDSKALPADLFEHWILMYIEQMQRLMLFNRVNKIISHPTVYAKLPFIYEITQYSTGVTVLCPNCNCELLGGAKAFVCRKCYHPVGKCGYCNEIVRGLFVWCQGCGHGGHLYHLAEWYRRTKTELVDSALPHGLLCPAGCGHMCEYM